MTVSNLRYFIPEVVQTSGMDCGPASLKSLLEGFGVPMSYGRLREACQTDVDGTSIDTMEEVAVQLGLDAEQIMVPVDHLLLPEAEALPAIVVIRLPNGFTHFVVAWKNHGGRLVQVMDPATGRRWPTVKQFLSSVYQHHFPVPAHDWREWAGSDEFIIPLKARLRRIGLTAIQVDHHLKTAVQDKSWRSLATLDAATRMVQGLIDSKGLRAGSVATAVLDTFISQTQQAQNWEASPIPETYWSVTPSESDEAGEGQLILNGAVLVRVKGIGNQGIDSGSEQKRLSPELVAALEEKTQSPLQTVWQLLRNGGVVKPMLLLLVLIFSSMGVLIESILFRTLIQNEGSSFQPMTQLGVLIILSTAILIFRFWTTNHALKVGRTLEVQLRHAFLKKIPKLRDQYFQSRPTSDMAQRSHAIYRLRRLPTLGTQLLFALCTLFFTSLGVMWLSPQNVGLTIILLIFLMAAPLGSHPFLAERDLRMRTHMGALSRFFLDALIGLVPIRTHGAERAVRWKHRSLLEEWGHTAHAFYRGVVSGTAVQSTVGFGMAIWILFRHISLGGTTDSMLLLVYWLMILPIVGQEISLIIRQYPMMRNTTLRLLEPLGAKEDGVKEAMQQSRQSPSILEKDQKGIALSFRNVSVQVAGQTVLTDLALSIQAGEHVAIVGPSGAGKSSLLGLLLGWYRPSLGTMWVDEARLDGQLFSSLHQVTAWVDPAVQLWNRSLIENLQYGNEDAAKRQMPEVVQQAELLSLLNKMPNGFQTDLGESGGLISGGEGQRIRLGRALRRKNVRLALLDEPFRGLSLQQRQQLLSRTRKLWRGATVLCVTHDVCETLAFDRVLVVENGRIVEDAAPYTLVNQPNSRYAALLNAEKEAREKIWGSPRWRKLRMENGTLFEDREFVR